MKFIGVLLGFLGVVILLYSGFKIAYWESLSTVSQILTVVTVLIWAGLIPWMYGRGMDRDSF